MLPALSAHALRAAPSPPCTARAPGIVLLTIFVGMTWLLGLAGCSAPPDDNREPRQDEAERRASRFMVATANPLAGEIGADILRAGGNAVDAAVAVQMVLSFVEAPETGIGGGGFMLVHEAASGRTRFFDGRETAPATAEPTRFTLLGQPLPLWAVVPSGRAVGVPGLVAMLHAAHAEHGRLPWAELFAPAIRLADHGIPAPARLQRQIAEDASLRFFGDVRALFHTSITADPPRLHNPQLAHTLRRIADEGASALYQGEIAQALVERAQTRWLWPSDLSVDDLAAYRPVERAPLCAPYREWTVCSAPPPSSGGVALLQMLGMLEHFPLAELGPDRAESLHLIAEASRLAFADRYQYLGDPDFVSIPVAGLLDRQYLAQRARLIDPEQAMSTPLPGEPGTTPLLPDAAPPDEDETTGTSHFSIVDDDGTVVALTSSIEAPFGARMAVHGMLLNNQLTDFTFTPTLEDGRPHPNAPGPGKRPRSSMTPTVVFDPDGNVRLVIGSRGGARITGYVLKTVIGVLDWELDVQHAIALPNIVDRGQGLELERGSSFERHKAALEELGHDVRLERMTSGLHGMERVSDGWRGGADPRLDGLALGD